MKNWIKTILLSPVVLFLIFMTLKLTNVIDWSWWWVTSPFWLPIAIAIFLIVVLIVTTIVFVFLFRDDIKDKIW